MSEINGPTELTAQERLNKMDDYLDQWEVSIGLDKISVPHAKSEALRYMDLPIDERKKITPENAADAVLVLAQFAAYISRVVQKEESKMFWLSEEIMKVIASRVNQQKGYSFEERKALAIAENEAAQRLERLRRESQAKWKRLAFHAMRVEKIAMAYQNLSNVRRRLNEIG